MSDERLALAAGVLQKACDAGDIPACVFRVQRGADLLLEMTAGQGVTPDSVFLLASITKPIVCVAAAILLERGLLDLDDPVSLYVPEFGGDEKEAVKIRHLLTHTSGLPDMLPNNEELRRRQAPIAAFVEATCRQPLLFPAGTRVSYQSMGILLLGEVIERLTGSRLRDFLRVELFGPLGMNSTSLGLDSEAAKRLVEATPVAGVQGSWVWNTPYWRDFGAPWGGAFSTTHDLMLFFRMLVKGGKLGGVQVLERATVRLMLTDHTIGVPDASGKSLGTFGWGLGWSLQRPGGGGWLGSLAPPGAFGHAGATGTLAWADPASGVICVILTNGGLLNTNAHTFARCANVVAAALC